MGLFDRWRTSTEEPWRAPVLGSCRCEQHVETMLEVAIPHGAEAGDGDGADDGGRTTTTVAALLDAGALEVREALPDERYVVLAHSGQRVGPLHWRVTLGEPGRPLYDDAAPVRLDDCLAVQPGVERVERLDAEAFGVGAPDLCPSGVRAAMVTALTNPRVRRAG